MGPSLDLPRTGKSISIALAFALRACVRACEAAWARDASAVAGVGQMQVCRGGSLRPSPPPVPVPPIASALAGRPGPGVQGGSRPWLAFGWQALLAWLAWLSWQA